MIDKILAKAQDLVRNPYTLNTTLWREFEDYPETKRARMVAAALEHQTKLRQRAEDELKFTREIIRLREMIPPLDKTITLLRIDQCSAASVADDAEFAERAKREGWNL